jgi:hypothetical protein
VIIRFLIGVHWWNCLGDYIRAKLAQNFIPIATDWKTTDWLIANLLLQANPK